MEATDGGEVYSPNVGGTSFNCTFLPRAEKYQKSRPKVLDIPHSRGDALWGRIHPCRSQHPAERRLLGSALRPRSYSPEHSPDPTLGRLTIDAPPRRPPVRPGGSVCGTNGSRDEIFGERFTAGMRFDKADSSRRSMRAVILRLRRS